MPAIATRPCLISAWRKKASVLSPPIVEKPYGSKTLPPVSGPTPTLRGAVHRLRALALPRLQCVVLSAPSLVSASPKPISAAKATHMDSTPICALSCCSLGAWTATLLGAKPETPPTIIIMSAKFRVRVSAGQTPGYVR